ncbi:MAG: hypothetical protein WB870_11120, partial [Gallionellaceae bacterium]
IPNRTVKRLCADDSVRPYVKVGHRQTPYKAKRPAPKGGAFCFTGLNHDLLARSDKTLAQRASCGGG